MYLLSDYINLLLSHVLKQWILISVTILRMIRLQLIFLFTKLQNVLTILYLWPSNAQGMH